MSNSRQPKAAGHRERLTNTSIAASGARDMESTKVMSNETDPTVVDQRSAEIGTTDSEMFITDAVDEDYDSGMSMVIEPRMQRSGGDSEEGVSGAANFIERNPDNNASTLEWKWGVLHSQVASQATSSSSCQQQTAEERWHASLQIEIERIRRHYHDQERILEREIVKHKQRYRSAMKQLENEENDEENYPITEWWDVQSDYQPTECGNDESRYLLPERELARQALGKCP